MTNEVLAEIGANDPEHTIPRIKIFNKIDFVGDATAQADCDAALKAKYPDCIVMSARRPEDIAKLHQIIVTFFQQDLILAELFLPWTAQQHRGEIYANCQVLAERSEENGAYFKVRGEANCVKKLQDKIN